MKFDPSAQIDADTLRAHAHSYIMNFYQTNSFEPTFGLVSPGYNAAGKFSAQIYAVDLDARHTRIDSFTMDFGTPGSITAKEWANFVANGGLAGRVDLGSHIVPFHVIGIPIGTPLTNPCGEDELRALDIPFQTINPFWANMSAVPFGAAESLKHRGYFAAQVPSQSWLAVPIDDISEALRRGLHPTNQIKATFNAARIDAAFERLANSALPAQGETFEYADIYAAHPLQLNSDCDPMRNFPLPLYYDFSAPGVVGTSGVTGFTTPVSVASGGSGIYRSQVCPFPYYIRNGRAVCLFVGSEGKVEEQEQDDHNGESVFEDLTESAGCKIPLVRMFEYSRTTGTGDGFQLSEAADYLSVESWPRAVFAQAVQSLIVRYMSKISSEGECITDYAIFKPVLKEGAERHSKNLGTANPAISVDLIIPTDGLRVDKGSGTRLDKGTRHYVYFSVTSDLKSGEFSNGPDASNVAGKTYWHVSVGYYASSRTNWTDALDFFGNVRERRLEADNSDFSDTNEDFTPDEREALANALARFFVLESVAAAEAIALTSAN